eukprot:m.351244 g.351244  ORF g.351244 m.351244 type:complete len:78 (+) comp51690_c0_seq1:129-362(+)
MLLQEMNVNIYVSLLLGMFTPSIVAIDNGLGLKPPMGWRSYNAFGGRPTQAIMEATMDALVDRSKNVRSRVHLLFVS